MIGEGLGNSIKGSVQNSVQKVRSKSIKSSKADSESQYEYDSQYESNDEDDDGSDAASQMTSGPAQSIYSQDDDDQRYLTKADEAMTKLENLHSLQSGSWKRVLKHRSGVVVYQSKDKQHAGPTGRNGKGYYAPVFKGEHEIRGFTPAAVFGVIGTRKLWDEWYKEGNLVQNLSDSASLTYMCMKGITGSSTRDLALVEKVQGSATGTILFCASSVTTPKVPRVSGRVRASIALNGWVLEPIDGGTRATYYLHVNVKTNALVPAFASTKYLARRPVCIAKIDEYLQSHGPPPMAGADNASTVSGAGSGAAAGAAAGVAAGAVAGGRGSIRRRNSVSSQRSRRSTKSSGGGSTSTGTGGLIAHVSPNSESKNYAALQKGQKLFRSLLGAGGWTVYTDHKDAKIFVKEKDGNDLPVVKGQTTIGGGITTEQVLGTILSGAARNEWDVRFLKSDLIDLENGHDQGVFMEAQKGIFPHLGAHHFVIVRGVEREDAGTDNGPITLISCTTKAKADAPEGSEAAQLDVSGWQIEEEGNGVKITHIQQKELEGDLKGPVRKILIGEIARGPTDVAEFIDDYGYAPYFIRWGDGPAQIEHDQGGDLTKGEAIFEVSGKGEGTMKDGQQKCWLQYSDKMYERGLDINVEPSDAVELSKVDGIDRTVQFTWTKNIKNGAKITLRQSKEGDGADDVYVDGEYLDKTVAMERGVGGAALAGRKKAKKVVPEDEDQGQEQEKSKKTDKQVDGDDEGASGDQKSGRGLAAAAIAAPVAAAGAVAAGARKAAGPAAPAHVDQEQLKQGTMPEDACLIISKDLYFTRSQCGFMAILFILAFLYGKISK